MQEYKTVPLIVAGCFQVSNRWVIILEEEFPHSMDSRIEQKHGLKKGKKVQISWEGKYHKRSRLDYPVELIRDAIERGMSEREACIFYNTPRSTWRRYQKSTWYHASKDC